jgi:hypothetical protein
MALREENSALHWAATRPEDNTPATAVAVGHFVQVGIPTGISIQPDSSRDTPFAVSGRRGSRRGNGVADARAPAAARMGIARVRTTPLDRYIHFHLYS